MAGALDPALSSTESHGEVHITRSRHAEQDESPLVLSRDSGILDDEKLACERAQIWSATDRFAFNAMLARSDYKNKLRLSPRKLERIVYFLTTPDAQSREKDRSDAQIKHQAQQWLYQDGILFRKESRLQKPRRHVSAEEAFDVLTAEHLKASHQGRDKMLKILEAKYIGYTKDELMLVLDRCSVCTSKHIRGAAMRRRENMQSKNLDAGSTPQPTKVDPNL